MAKQKNQDWELWFPKAAATGLPFARGRIAPCTHILVHAAPPVLSVTVRDGVGTTLAHGQDLEATAETPITRLTLRGEHVEREDIWPGPQDLGSVVLLPGGEAGILKAWWHAGDHSEWRWQVEFYNSRGEG
jgi:hypothetical protein